MLLTIAAVTVFGNTVQVTAGAKETAHVGVTATDTGGPGTTESFTVHRCRGPSATIPSSVTPRISGLAAQSSA